MTRVCRTCDKELPIESFYVIRRSEPAKRRTKCKDCENATRRIKIPYHLSDSGVPLCKCHNEEMIRYKNVRYDPSLGQQEHYWQCRVTRKKINEKNYSEKKEKGIVYPSESYEYQRAKRLEKYGLSIEDYDRMLEEQENVCAICGGPPDTRWNVLAVDHCHTSLKVRGLLCMKCNTMLGRVEAHLDSISKYMGWGLS